MAIAVRKTTVLSYSQIYASIKIICTLLLRVGTSRHSKGGQVAEHINVTLRNFIATAGEDPIEDVCDGDGDMMIMVMMEMEMEMEKNILMVVMMGFGWFAVL